MRLLHFDSLDRLVLTDFSGKPIPPYAILSHRWSGSEILLDDVRSGAYKKRVEGYRKLKFCARQATQDGLRYFWIDTCCIDRWNLPELSKAINYMFKWYKHASRCYVFLPDVLVPTGSDSLQRSDWDSSFRNSAWFTRGWTLQELIAPVSVEFFSFEGRRIGDRASLDDLIHNVTGIPIAALRNCPLDNFSTSERRRWTVNRETTEKEDIVYCLLGLLGVSMPTAYGEGLESAQRRLQAEVDAIGSAPTIIPFSRNPSFVGRQSELARLEAKLFDSSCASTAMLAVVGPGGIGKSQLVLEVAHRTRHVNKQCCIFWLDASDKTSLYQSYASIAQKLLVAGSEDERGDMKLLIRRCIIELETRQCLLVFDNVEDTEGGSSTTEATALTDFLPRSKTCSVILTTTHRDLIRTLYPQNIIVLQSLSPDVAMSMLQSQMARPLSGAQYQEAQSLVRELSCLPLAIVQAAACLNVTGTTLQEYRAGLSAHKERTPEHDNDLSEDLRGSGVEDPVAATLSVSLEQISPQNVSATDFLFLAACVHRRDVLLNLLDATPPHAREETIQILARYALAVRRPAESALDVPRPVHQALRKQLSLQGKLQHWSQRALTKLLQVFPDDDQGNRSKKRRLLPHVQRVLSDLQDHDNDSGRRRLAWLCAMAFYDDGRYAEAEDLGMQVMKVQRRLLGSEHLDTLLSMNQMVLIYINAGRWQDAEVLAVELLAVRRRLLGEDHLHTLTSMANLALIYINNGRWKEAEELGLHVVEMRKKKLGCDDRETLISMANLASTLSHQGRWKAAAELDRKVIDGREKALGEEHLDILGSFNNLAVAYLHLGRWKEAEKLHLHVTASWKRIFGDEHPHTLVSMSNLASTYRQQGRLAEAEELLVSVLQEQRRLLSAEHPDTMASLASLSSTYGEQGRWGEAETLCLQVVDLRTRVSGADHPATLTGMSNLATAYRNKKQYCQAEQLEDQVLHKRRRVLGDEHPDTLASMHNLASTYWRQDQHTKAGQLGEQVVQMRERVLGSEHLETLASRSNLALAYGSQSRWKESEALNVQVLEARRRLLGDHAVTLISMHNLASVYGQQGRWEDAEKLFTQATAARKKVLGLDHPETLSSMGNLASTYSRLGRWADAETTFVQVAAAKERVLGTEHPETLAVQSNLALTYWAQKRWKAAEELQTQVAKTRQKVLGDEHPDSLGSMGRLAWMCWQEHDEEADLSDMQPGHAEIGPRDVATIHPSARRSEAIALMETCFETSRRVLGDEHSTTWKSRDILDSWAKTR